VLHGTREVEDVGDEVDRRGVRRRSREELVCLLLGRSDLGVLHDRESRRLPEVVGVDFVDLMRKRAEEEASAQL
jgi:hypothetical protein